MFDVLEIPLEFGKKRSLGAALQHLAKKDTARRQYFTGETGRGMVIVLAGLVRVTRRNALGQEHPVVEHGPGHFLAEVAQLSGK